MKKSPQCCVTMTCRYISTSSTGPLLCDHMYRYLSASTTRLVMGNPLHPVYVAEISLHHNHVSPDIRIVSLSGNFPTLFGCTTRTEISPYLAPEETSAPRVHHRWYVDISVFQLELMYINIPTTSTSLLYVEISAPMAYHSWCRYFLTRRSTVGMSKFPHFSSATSCTEISLRPAPVFICRNIWFITRRADTSSHAD